MRESTCCNVWLGLVRLWLWCRWRGRHVDIASAERWWKNGYTFKYCRWLVDFLASVRVRKDSLLCYPRHPLRLRLCWSGTPDDGLAFKRCHCKRTFRRKSSWGPTHKKFINAHQHYFNRGKKNCSHAAPLTFFHPCIHCSWTGRTTHQQAGVVKGCHCRVVTDQEGKLGDASEIKGTKKWV